LSLTYETPIISGCGSDGGTLTARSVVSPPALPADGSPSRAGRPAESFDIARCRVGVPRRRGRAKIIPDGGATGAGSLAATSDQQILAAGSLAGTGGPVLAPRAGGL
jgi:hypothetical protein